MPYMQISERLLILRLGLVCNSSYVSAFSTYLKTFLVYFTAWQYMERSVNNDILALSIELPSF